MTLPAMRGLAYGALGLPLAFVALPLYVMLPAHYGTLGVPLAALGLLLLGARLFDAVVDPWIGRWVDRRYARGPGAVVGAGAVAAMLLAAGFVALFFPPVQGTAALLTWCGAALALTYVAYSLLSVVHQAWGARLGGDAAHRARVVSWREGLALAGVLVASVLPSLAGLPAAAAVLAATLALGLLALARWAPAATGAVAATTASSPWLPLRTPAFRRLLAVHLVNGVASAIPATLVLFFVRDRLQAPEHEPWFLVAYFAAGALSMPLWVRLIARYGLARSWLSGMLLAVAAFVWAAGLGPGDTAAFAAVCVASGLALGADLAVPQAWLAGIVQRAGHQGQLEGSYFGWWNFATKLELALAAGLALPLLQLFGYTPGGTDPQGLQALSMAYALLPCALKLVAAGLLATFALRRDRPALPEHPAETPT